MEKKDTKTAAKVAKVKKYSKRVTAAKENLSHKNIKTISEAIEALKETKNSKFEESFDLNLSLGINPKKSDETVKGEVNFSTPIPKNAKILVFATGAKAEEAKAAGADKVGGEELIAEIKKSGKAKFDYCLCETIMFTKVVGLAKILSRKKLMPNEKEGTLTNNIKESIQNIREGKKRVFRNDSAGIVSMCFGKTNFSTESLLSNLKDCIDAINSVKPAKVKEYFKKCYLTTTMGQSVKVSTKSLYSIK